MAPSVLQGAMNRAPTNIPHLHLPVPKSSILSRAEYPFVRATWEGLVGPEIRWAAAIAVAAPTATLTLNQPSFRRGNPLRLDLRLLTPPTVPPGGLYSFELKWWLLTPLAFPADRIALMNLAGPGNAVSLPPSFDRTFTLIDTAVPADFPLGSSEFGVRLIHPITGESYDLSTAPFEVLP